MARQGYDLQVKPGLRPASDSVRRAWLAGHLLHDRDGALAHERDGHRMGAHTLARDAAGCEGGATTGQPRGLGRMPNALDQQNRLSAVPALGAFQFPGREATDVNVKRVDVGRRAVACELNL